MCIKSPRAALYLIIMISSAVSTLTIPSQAASGTAGASFLDIPVGAGPASMGAAYSARADDAYAATLNPGGLGFLPSTEFAAQHLSYVDSIHYEYLSFALPLPMAPRASWGGSVQYLGSGNVAGTDATGQPIGDFSSHYAAYNLAYGRVVTDQLSLGITGKWINAKIDDVSANAYALDFGSMFRASEKLTLSSVLTNVGSKLTFLQQRDSLPLAFRLGAAYQPNNRWNISTEAVYRQTGLASAHLGFEWHPLPMYSLRTGYRTDTVRGLGALAGFATGFGVHAHKLEFSYAWVPLGDLGSTHYFSLVLRLRESGREKRNLIQYQPIKKRALAKNDPDATESDFQQLMELLSNDDAPVSRRRPR